MQPKKAIGAKEGKSQKLRLTLLVSNQVLVSWRMPSIDWCGLEESILCVLPLIALVQLQHRRSVCARCVCYRFRKLKRVGANNNCFFVSGRLPVIHGSHKPKMTTRRAQPPMIHDSLLSSPKKMRSASKTNYQQTNALYCSK